MQDVFTTLNSIQMAKTRRIDKEWQEMRAPVFQVSVRTNLPWARSSQNGCPESGQVLQMCACQSAAAQPPLAFVREAETS